MDKFTQAANILTSQLKAGGLRSVFILFGMNDLQGTKSGSRDTVTMKGRCSGSKIQRGGRFAITYRFGTDDYQIQLYTADQFGIVKEMLYDSGDSILGHSPEDFKRIFTDYLG